MIENVTIDVWQFVNIVVISNSVIGEVLDLQEEADHVEELVGDGVGVPDEGGEELPFQADEFNQVVNEEEADEGNIQNIVPFDFRRPFDV